MKAELNILIGLSASILPLLQFLLLTILKVSIWNTEPNVSPFCLKCAMTPVAHKILKFGIQNPPLFESSLLCQPHLSLCFWRSSRSNSPSCIWVPAEIHPPSESPSASAPDGETPENRECVLILDNVYEPCWMQITVLKDILWSEVAYFIPGKLQQRKFN